MAIVVASIPPSPPHFAPALAAILPDAVARYADRAELVNQNDNVFDSEGHLVFQPYRLETNGGIAFTLEGDDTEFLQGLAARIVATAAIPGLFIEAGSTLTVSRNGSN